MIGYSKSRIAELMKEKGYGIQTPIDNGYDFVRIEMDEFDNATFNKLMNTHGGARPGAGRKKGEETVQFGCRLKVETKQFLQDQAAQAGITVTEVLETIIQIFKDEHK